MKYWNKEGIMAFLAVSKFDCDVVSIKETIIMPNFMHRNSPKNHKVTAIYTVLTLNIPLILFKMTTPKNAKKASNKI